MSADISRASFDWKQHFARVILQQGRPLLDADFNEQVAILLHRLGALTRDLVGDRWGPPEKNKALKLELVEKDNTKQWVILKGHYYVNGILCENDKEQSINKQDDLPRPQQTPVGFPDGLEMP